MNNKFFEIPDEKQLRIINAGFEVFSQNEYKKASTDEIAHRAEISKGLLFYYFHNKKEFYMFLYDYAFREIQENVVSDDFNNIKDFFELCKYAATRKYELLIRTPYLSDFIVRAFYSHREAVTDAIDTSVTEVMSDLFEHYFSHVDFSRFREDVDPKEIYSMMVWMTDGFMHEQQRNQEHLNMDEILVKYDRWSELLKRVAYK
ncbi:MAG: TetR/AcrR family transcriptional regulator [Lachnospiraceae bacterium]